MKLLNRLTRKHLLMNKKRTIVTIIGVILSCALMMGIGLLISSVYQNLEDSILKYSGNYHVKLDGINRKDLNTVKQNVYVESVDYAQLLSFAKPSVNGEIQDDFFSIKGVNDSYFKSITLEEGRLPNSSTEVVLPTELKDYYDTSYQIGDTIELQWGTRYLDGESIFGEDAYEEETWESQESKTYKIVGFYSELKYGMNSFLPIFTKDDGTQSDHISTWVTYRSNKKIHEKTESVVSHLDTKLNDNQILYHEELLSLYGQSKYGNYNKTLIQVALVILSLVSIACIIVIYNSFQISVMERKKQFGLFSSIGATPKQIRYTVFYEAFLIAIIAIPIGIIGAYLGIDVVIHCVNHFLPGEFDPVLTLSVNSTFVLIPLLFILFVIFLSAWLPARRASKITPIEAIRQNDDIKIKGKKVKTNKFVEKVFGVEGTIALKNIKRNKKKYRITIISLFISIVLFISFSGILKYGLKSTESILETVDYDISIFVQNRNKDKIEDVIDTITHDSSVEKSNVTQSYVIEIPFLKKEVYQETYYQLFSDYLKEDNSYGLIYDQIYLYTLSDENYQQLKKEIGQTDNTPILINYTVSEYFDEKGNKKVYSGPIFNEDNLKSIPLYYKTMEDESENKVKMIDSVSFTETIPFGLKALARQGQKIMIINEALLNEIKSLALPHDEGFVEYYDYEIILKANDIEKLDRKLDKIEEDKTVETFAVNNVIEGQKLQRNVLFVAKILLYGFIGLVTLIGITSVFNTINTSLLLRKKEFAMLRSIGLTPHGFKKILWFESLFFVLKALLYALPVSFLILLVIDHVLGSAIVLDTMLIPWQEILLAIVFSFIIVLITTIYSTRKMRKENILEAIREENI